jgi:elongation factor Tu
VAGGSTADGAAVQQRTQNGGTSQRWQIMPAEPGCYKIQNEASGRVLQVTGGPSAVAPATPVQQWDWIGGDNQMWRLTR